LLYRGDWKCSSSLFLQLIALVIKLY
jgi:hypothetical protein